MHGDCKNAANKEQLTNLKSAALGDPGGIQTHDLQNRNLTLYSAKLRSRLCVVYLLIDSVLLVIFFRNQSIVLFVGKAVSFNFFCSKPP